MSIELWEEKHLLDEMERVVKTATEQSMMLGLGATAIRKHPSSRHYAQKTQIAQIN